MDKESLFKGWFTTLMGCVLMGLAVYDWWNTPDGQPVNWVDVGGTFIAGYALLYMKDKISDWISNFVMAVISKFTSK